MGGGNCTFETGRAMRVKNFKDNCPLASRAEDGPPVARTKTIATRMAARGRTSRPMISLLALLGLPVGLLTTHAQTFSETPSEKFWETDGPVNAIADGGEVVYLGGSFGYAGPYTGCAVALDTKTAAVNSRFPP